MSYHSIVYHMVHLSCAFKRILDACILLYLLVYFRMHKFKSVYDLYAFKMYAFEIKKIIVWDNKNLKWYFNVAE